MRIAGKFTISNPSRDASCFQLKEFYERVISINAVASKLNEQGVHRVTRSARHAFTGEVFQNASTVVGSRRTYW